MKLVRLQLSRKMTTCGNNSLRLDAQVEFSQLGCNDIHKVWALVKLQVPDEQKIPAQAADFVIAIDKSTSMSTDD